MAVGLKEGMEGATLAVGDTTWELMQSLKTGDWGMGEFYLFYLKWSWHLWSKMAAQLEEMGNKMVEKMEEKENKVVEKLEEKENKMAKKPEEKENEMVEKPEEKENEMVKKQEEKENKMEEKYIEEGSWPLQWAWRSGKGGSRDPPPSPSEKSLPVIGGVEIGSLWQRPGLTKLGKEYT
ncbi:adipocyte enhancer-binding protein 1-like [Manis pentadactyla]|uniref:adipocyte enhancer-binding protein 1-like n=1 Tax=Manis pentadactyla TaxID=143292 RepID=UPI00255CE02F|nr:adipocyte enhancer-binding protein 1-like [Manis pentadactyla]